MDGKALGCFGMYISVRELCFLRFRANDGRRASAAFPVNESPLLPGSRASPVAEIRFGGGTRGSGTTSLELPSKRQTAVTPGPPAGRPRGSSADGRTLGSLWDFFGRLRCRSPCHSFPDFQSLMDQQGVPLFPSLRLKKPTNLRFSPF